MQQWHKGPRPDTAATKQEGIHQDVQENHWAGDRGEDSQIFCRVTKDQGLDIVDLKWKKRLRME
jgi:hypothetical protein